MFCVQCTEVELLEKSFVPVLFNPSCECDDHWKLYFLGLQVSILAPDKSVWLLMVTWQSQTLWKLCSHRTSSCTETENILAAVCHFWLSPPGVGPLVRMDVPSTVFRGWFLCWRPSASWLLSPGTDITSTAPVSTTFSPRYSFFCFVLFFWKLNFRQFRIQAKVPENK